MPTARLEGSAPQDLAEATLPPSIATPALMSERPGGEDVRARAPTLATGTTGFETFLDEFAAAFVRVSALEIDDEIERWLERLVEFFGADRSSVAEFTPVGFVVTHSWARRGFQPVAGRGEVDMPYLAAKLRRGEMMVYNGPQDLPPEAVHERRLVQRDQLKSHISVPLVLSGEVIGGLGLGCMQRSRAWPEDVVQRFRLIGTVLGNALGRKRAVQEHLQLSRSLEHAGRVATIGQLASSFAHEIKQPLGASLTNAETALRLLDAPQLDLAEIRAALQDIASDNRRAGQIVNEWRRFLRRQEPAFAPVPAGELFEAVVRFVSPEARAQDVELRVDAAGDLPSVNADRTQIQQVLVNLLLNAFDALVVRPLRRRRVVLFAEPGSTGRITFSVRDSGPGVPDALLTRLFEPFVTTKPQGLGIGLAIAQTIVTAHGSRLAYSEAEDGGAVFSFSLAATRDPHGG